MNSFSVALRAGYLSVRTAEGASEKQSSLKARVRNELTYLLTYLLTYIVLRKYNSRDESESMCVRKQLSGYKVPILCLMDNEKLCRRGCRLFYIDGRWEMMGVTKSK